MHDEIILVDSWSSDSIDYYAILWTFLDCIHSLRGDDYFQSNYMGAFNCTVLCP